MVVIFAKKHQLNLQHFFEKRRNNILQNQQNKKIFERFSTERIKSSLHVSIRMIGKVRKLTDHTEKQKSETETPAKNITLENKENEGSGMRFH